MRKVLAGNYKETLNANLRHPLGLVNIVTVNGENDSTITKADYSQVGVIDGQEAIAGLMATSPIITFDSYRANSQPSITDTESIIIDEEENN
jgi:hypothetical protein